jgi:DNA replication licensing factor MCM4
LPSVSRQLTDYPYLLQILNLLDKSGRSGLRWQAAIKSLEEQSTVPIDGSEFAEVIKELEHEGVVKIVGERERRTIKRVSE